ncbi:MAG: hypothetical protein AAFY60_10580 [Myxococcota bacterium]
MSNFWNFPEDGQTPSLNWVTEAASLDALVQASEPHWKHVAQAQQRAQRRATDSLLATAKELETKGVNMQSLVDELGTSIDDLYDEDVTLSDDDYSDEDGPMIDSPFVFVVPLASTVPSREIVLDYEETEERIRGFLRDLEREISKTRQHAPLRLSVSDERVDELLESDEADDHMAFHAFHLLLGLIAYWPPEAGKPALALSHRQEDNGLPHEIELLAHGPEGHQALLAQLPDWGARLIG